MPPRPDLSMTPEAIRALLDEPLTGVLATIGPGGFPHSVGIFYLPVPRGDELELKMWVYGKSQKAKNVERDPRASLLVEQGEPYVDLRGVLVGGNARIENGYDDVLELGKRIYDRYFLPRTQVPLEDGPIANIEKQSQKRVNIVLRAERFASWDHGRGRDTITSS